VTKDPTDTRRIKLTLEAIRANPTGRAALKLGIGLLGGVVVAIGIVLIPLPGPGWLIVIAGLAIWAVEFVWARHLLRFTRDKLRGWTAWVGRQSWAVRILIGAAGLIFVAAVAAATLRLSFGVNIVGDAWRYITSH
jgi:uncharacterized protein (TIGR02611 family)